MIKIYNALIYGYRHINAGIGSKALTHKTLTASIGKGYILFLIGLFFGANEMFAQSAANYTATTNTAGSLALDKDGNAIDMATGTTLLYGTDVDTYTASVQNFGFTFVFMGTAYTQWSANPDGQLRLGSTIITGHSLTSPLSNTAYIIANNIDSATGASTGKVHYKVQSGTSGKVLIIEWKDIKINWNGAGATLSTFQTRIYESGAFETVYGQMWNSATSSLSDFIGFSSGTATGYYANITTTPAYNTGTTYSSTGNSFSASSAMTNLNSSVNGSRRVFRFTPPAAPANPTLSAFSAVTVTTTTVNWTDNSSNELGFIVTRATDAAFTENVVTTSVASNVITSAQTGLTPGTTYYYKVQAINEGSASSGVTGSQATTPAATYYWVGATGATWSTAASWNTAADGSGSTRATPLTTDILIIDGAGTTAGAATTINVDANYSIGVLRVTNNTAATIQSSATTTRTITITGGSGDDFDIVSGSSVLLNHATNGIAIAFSTGTTGNIAGTFTVSNSTNNYLNTTNAVVTVNGTLNHGPATSTIAMINSTAASLKFASGSNYNFLYTNYAGTIPTAEWNVASNVNITGCTNPSSAPSGLSQTFGNFNFNCTAQSAAINWTGNTPTAIAGTLSVLSTNGNEWRLGSTHSPIWIVNNYTQSGGTVNMASSSGNATLRVSGTFNMTGGTITEGSTGTTNGIEFNGTSAQNVTIGGTISQTISVTVSNTAGINLTGTLPINNGAGLTIASGNITGTGSVSYDSTSSRLSYTGTAAQTATANEWPATNGPLNITINNTATSPANTVTVPFNRTLTSSGILTLTAGLFNNNGYTLTLSNTTTGAITGYTSAKYITGALERTLPASASSANYDFPVGKSIYNLFELRGVTTNNGGTVKIKAEAIDADPAGTIGSGMSALNTNRYWAASITSGAANFTSTSIRLTDTSSGSIVTNSAIGASSTVNGAYALVGGTTPTIVAGSTIQSATPAATTLAGYYAIGLKGVNMAYSSSAVTQASTAVVLRPSVNQQIVMLQVVTTGNINQLHIQGLDLTTTGVTALSDITKVTVYSTGASSTFATTTTFGTVSNPATAAFTVTGDITLLEGNNYFFVVYDISSTAVVNHTVDAQIPGITISGVSQAPSTPNPAGTRTIKGPLNGDYTIGASGTYATLTAAAQDLFDYGVEAPVRLLLSNGSFGGTIATSTSGVAETYPIAFKTITGASATNTVTITPATGATVTITGDNSTALLNLNGVNYLTFNGSNNATSTKDLTISNTNTSGSTIVFINGASNNSIKNCIVKGVATSASNAVILLSTSTGSTGNVSNTITANDIMKGATAVRACIYNLGASGKSNNNNVISNNRLMDFTGYGFQDSGYSSNTLLEGNEIFQNSSQSTNMSGIFIDHTTSIFTMRISKNKIYSLTTSGTGNIYGININNVASATVINNMVSLSNTTGTLRGISQSAGSAATVSFYHNTVSISGTASGTDASYAFIKSGGATGDNVKNNIFSNTRVSSGTGKQYAIAHNSGSMVSDYNNLYSTGNFLNIFGQYSNADVASLSAWQNATPGDDNSANILPNFTSATNLHLLTGSNGAINNLGTQLTGVTGADTDIDGDSRTIATPDMGADEFTPVGCTGATGGTATASATGTFCNSASTTISVTGYSIGLNTTYRWQSSSDMAFTNPVDLGSSSTIYSNLSTGTITTTTYYRLKVTCGDTTTTDYSSVASVTIVTPTVASTTPGARCGAGTVQLAATGAPGTVLKWYAAASGGSELYTGNTYTTPSISVTTPYYVAATVQGAGDLAIGAGNSTGIDSPYNITSGSYGGMKGQYLFTAAELTAAGLLPGNISKLAFELTATGATLQGFTIQMGITALSAFPSGGDLQGGLTTVRNAATLVPAVGVNALTFDTPFNWDGVSNIIVSTSWSNNNSTNSASTIKYDTTSFISSQGYKRDNVTPAVMMSYTGTSPGAGSFLTGSTRPKITFTGMTAAGCVSPRQAVTATINTPPALTLSSSSGTLCPGISTGAITITSAESDYDTYTVTSVPADAPYSGNSEDGFIFSPVVNTVYTITGTQAGGDLCNNSATYTVTMAVAPLAVTVTPDNATLCSGQVQQLTVSGGTSGTESIISQNFNGSLGSWTTSNESVDGNPANSAWTLRNSGYIYNSNTYTSNDNSTFIMSNSDSQGLGAITLTYVNSPSFSLAGHASAKLNFYHYYKQSSNGSGTVLISTDGGNNWETLHIFSANEGASQGFVPVELDLTDYAGLPNVMISFEFYAEYGWYWAIDNISVNVPQLPVSVWSPSTGLYTDAGATMPYGGGAAVTVYAKPDITTTYTATYTNVSGCSTSGTSVITVSPKQWIGADDTSWNNPDNWCGGQVPTAFDNIVISEVDNQPVITGNITVTGGSLTVEEGASLTVEGGSVLDITNAVTVDPAGSLVLENYAHLMQGDNVTTNPNVGSIEVNRLSSPIYRLDYTMWSSPVEGQMLKAFSPETLDNRFYKYNEVTDAYSMIQNPAETEMAEGTGYLIRVENTHPAYNETTNDPGVEWQGKFTGRPRSGNIDVPMSTTLNGFNAVGNPYPSPINIYEFYAANAGTIADGSALYFWRKKNESGTGSYARVTKLAYTANASNVGGDTGGTAFDGDPSTWVLNPGQGFIVKATGGTLHFNNAMRVGLNNQQFFRTAQDENEAGISRLWLNFTGTTGQFSQTAIGYTAMTTVGIDYGWDGKALINDGNAALFSLAGEEMLGIQARAEFNPTDVVPLGYKADAPGTYTIKLDHMDGVFATDQDIYLKDNVLGGLIYDLKAGDYTFETEAGVFNSRFEIVYADETLGNHHPEANPDNVIVYKQGAAININSGALEMTDIAIYDIRGRMLYKKEGINAAETVISNLQSDQQVLIIQIGTEQGRVTKRIIF